MPGALDLRRMMILLDGVYIEPIESVSRTGTHATGTTGFTKIGALRELTRV